MTTITALTSVDLPAGNTIILDGTARVTVDPGGLSHVYQQIGTGDVIGPFPKALSVLIEPLPDESIRYAVESPMGVSDRPITRDVFTGAITDPAAQDAVMAYGANASGLSLCSYPADFQWSHACKPNVFVSSAGVYSANVNPRAFVNPAIWTGAAYHVDVATGNNSNSGLGAFDGDFTNAKQSINNAITTGNATGAPYRIYVRAGYYADSRSINGSSGSVEPTQHIAIIAVGGTVLHNAGDGAITWTLDGTYTNLYKYTVGSIQRVFDLAQTDADGGPLELTAAADLATCNSTDNTYIHTGGVVYVNRADGQPATTSNTVVTRSLVSAQFLTHTGDIYVEGFRFFGGTSGGFFAEAIASRNIVTVNCQYIGAGHTAYLFDGHRVRRTNGLVLDINGRCYSCAKDGFNYHYDNGPAGGKMHVVLINPIGNGNGRYTSTSNNGITTHDDVRLIAVNPTCIANRSGADFHTIENTETVIFGGTLANTSAGGATPNAALKASNNAKIWVDGPTISATTGDAVYAQGAASQIYFKRPKITAGRVLVDSGTVVANW